jgi:hypothetical protein
MWGCSPDILHCVDFMTHVYSIADGGSIRFFRYKKPRRRVNTHSDFLNKVSPCCWTLVLTWRCRQNHLCNVIDITQFHSVDNAQRTSDTLLCLQNFVGCKNVWSCATLRGPCPYILLFLWKVTFLQLKFEWKKDLLYIYVSWKLITNLYRQ